MVVAVLVLDMALDAVSEVVVAGNAGVGGCDVAVAVGSSGPGLGGQRVRWGAMARPGSECRHLQGAGGSFWARNGVVVVVDDIVGVVDDGCACVARGDMAAGGGDNGVAVGLSLRAVCITASAVQVEVVWEAVSTVVGPHLIIQASCSAVLPLSSPSLSPFSYPSRLPSSSVAVLAFLIVL